MGNLPPIVKLAYDLNLWFLKHIEKFPRSHRFTLGDRLETALIETLETLVEAAYLKNKRTLLEQANRRLNRIRLLMRLATDLRIFSLTQQEFASKQIEQIGMQLGGWIKSQREERTENAVPSA